MSKPSGFNKDKCPVCGNLTTAGSEKYLPFCSNRCQQVDLGIWFTEGYSIPAIDPPDDMDFLLDELDEG